VIQFAPLVVWELSLSRYCLSVAIHACEWTLVFILWRDNYFILCCTLYATDYDHVLMLWVVPHVPEDIGWIDYDFYITCAGIWSSVYLYIVLWWWCVNIDCTLLHLYGLIGHHHSVVEWDSTLGVQTP
jgi:hypothetical protein